MQNLSDLSTITGPKEVAFRRAWPVIESDSAWRLLLDCLEVPQMPRRNLHHSHFALDGKVLRGTGHRVQKRSPNLLCLLQVKPVEQHRNLKAISALKSDLFAPARIEQVLLIETHNPSYELAESSI